MGLNCGIVGLPNVGKSTIFSAVTSAPAEAANYPFCTIDPNVGIVAVPDSRLDRIAELIPPERKIPATVEFVDIAGLVKGASKGEGLGNQFLANIRETDAIIEVVRCFDDPNTIHVTGKVDPIDDIETINTELALADMASLEKRQQRLSKVAKTGDKDAIAELAVVEKLLKLLEDGKFINVKDHFDEDEQHYIKFMHLMTTKPVIYAANVSETDLATGNDYVNRVKEYAKTHNADVVVISAKIEAELSELGEEEKKDYLAELGVENSGIERMFKSVYHLLDLRTFITAGEMEVKAWTIPAGAKAPQAAGVIHTDFEKGFIRAEVTSYDDFVACGSYAAAKDKGLTRLEGKDYVVQDGDIVHFRFAV